MAEKSGGKTCVRYMVVFVRRMNMDRTEMTTFQSVTLQSAGRQHLASIAPIMHDALPAHERKGGGVVIVHLIPRRRHRDGLVVGVGVEDLDRVAVPAVQRALGPHLRPVRVRVCDAEEGQGGDGGRELDGAEGEHGALAVAPLQVPPPRDAGQLEAHRGGLDADIWME